MGAEYNVSHPLECQQLCQDMLECAYWNYLHQEKKCAFKGSTSTIIPYNKAQFSFGPRYCPGMYKIYHP